MYTVCSYVHFVAFKKNHCTWLSWQLFYLIVSLIIIIGTTTRYQELGHGRVKLLQSLSLYYKLF